MEAKKEIIPINPVGQEEVIEINLRDYPNAFKAKVEELLEQGAVNSRQEAEEIASQPIQLELYYHKNNGLFAVESEAVEASEMGGLYSPYDREVEMVAPYNEEEAESTPETKKGYVIRTQWEEEHYGCSSPKSSGSALEGGIFKTYEKALHFLKGELYRTYIQTIREEVEEFEYEYNADNLEVTKHDDGWDITYDNGKCYLRYMAFINKAEYM